MAKFNFQKMLKKSILYADPMMDKTELLEDIFKTYVAKMFEHTMTKGDDRIEFEAMVTVKSNLINEFRRTELGEEQRSVEWYEKLFDKTMQEILNDAAKNHQGVDEISIQKKLEINPEAYVKEGGLFVPDHMKTS